MQLLDQHMRDVNPYCKVYKMLYEFEREQNAMSFGATMPKASLRFKRMPGEDLRRFNIPSVGEIAAIFTGEDGLPPEDRDFVVFHHNRQQELIRLSDLSRHIDPLCYPCLDFYGAPGWTTGMSHDKDFM